MQASEVESDRSRKNQRLAGLLFAVTFLVLALMVFVVVSVRSGLLPRFAQHAIRSLMG